MASPSGEGRKIRERVSSRMTKMDRRRLFLYRLGSLLVLADQYQIPVVSFTVYRSAEDQKKEYDAGRSMCDGTIKLSKHQDWMAADLAILTDDRTDILWDDPRYAKLGELAGKIGLVWGGSWTGSMKGDVYHFELGEDTQP
jgi:hypothetical protein